MILYLLFLAVILISITSLVALIVLLKKPIWLFVYIPLVLAVIGMTTYTYDELLGTPTTKDLPKDFIVASYLVDEPKNIFLWIVKDRKKLLPIGYVIPYTKQMHKRLEGAKKKMRKGGGVIEGKRREVQVKKGAKKSYILDFRNYKFPDQQLPRKNH